MGIGDLHPCWSSMVRWAAYGNQKAWLKMKPSDLKTAASKLYDEIWPNGAEGKATRTLSREEVDFHDLNEDGHVSKDEFLETVLEWQATEKIVSQEKVIRPMP